MNYHSTQRSVEGDSRDETEPAEVCLGSLRDGVDSVTAVILNS